MIVGMELLSTPGTDLEVFLETDTEIEDMIQVREDVKGVQYS